MSQAREARSRLTNDRDRPGGTSGGAARSQGEALSDWANRHADTLMLAPSALLLAGLILGPTAYLAYVSLSRLEITNAGEPAFIGFSNYVRLLTDEPEFWASISRSAFYVFVNVPIEFLIGLGLALLMNERLRGIRIIRTLMIMPMAMTPVVVGMIWLVLYNPNHGLINYLLSLVGIEGPAWTADPALALPAVMFVDAWQSTPFIFLVVTAALLTIPQDIIDASRVDGAAGWTAFRHITFPQIRRVALVAVLILFIDSWKAFDGIFALTKGGPGTASQTVNFYAYLQGFQWFHLGLSAAVIVLGVITAAICAELFLRAEPQLVDER